MTRQETIKVLAILSTAFPKMINGDANDAAELWCDLFADVPFEIVKLAVQKYILTAIFPPTIAAIRQMCAEITSGRIPSWEEAYEEVKRAVGKFGRERPQEFLDSLNLTTGEAMRLFGVKEFCNYNIEDGDGTLRAQFRDTYRNVSERENKQTQLPDRLKVLIGEIGIKQITE